MKKLLALVLVLCLFMGSFPVSSLAAVEDFEIERWRTNQVPRARW